MAAATRASRAYSAFVRQENRMFRAIENGDIPKRCSSYKRTVLEHGKYHTKYFDHYLGITVMHTYTEFVPQPQYAQDYYENPQDYQHNEQYLKRQEFQNVLAVAEVGSAFESSYSSF